jgi:hypothetical protein
MNVKQSVEKELAVETEKPAQVPLCPPQIPHNQTWALTRAAAEGSQRLSA